MNLPRSDLSVHIAGDVQDRPDAAPLLDALVRYGDAATLARGVAAALEHTNGARKSSGEN